MLRRRRALRARVVHRSRRSSSRAAPFPARRLGGAARGARGRRATTSGDRAVRGRRDPARGLHAGARRYRRPFVLWASVWAQPRSLAHALALPLTRHIYRHADAVIAYGEHVRRFVAGIRGRDDDVFVAPQSVEPELFGRPVADGRDRRVPRRARAAATARWCCTWAGWCPRRASRCCSTRGRRSAPTPTLVLIGDGPLAAARPASPRRPAARRRCRARSCPVAYAAADARGAALDPDAALPRAMGPGLQRGDAPGPAGDRHRRGRAPWPAGWCATATTGWSSPPGDAVGARGGDRPRCSATRRCARAWAARRAQAVAAYTYDAMVAGVRPRDQRQRAQRPRGAPRSLTDREQRLEVVARVDLEGDHGLGPR